MTIRLVYSSPRQTCYGVQEVAQGQFDHLVARPWNMYEPDTTMWWLVPSNDWPAYPHGKLYFNWAGDDRQHLWVGFHSEKGLDPKISSVYASARGSRLIMHPDWHWFNLLKNLENGRLAELTHQMANSLNAPMMVRLVGSYVPDPTDFDPYGSLLKKDEYWLEWDDAQRQFVVRLIQSEGNALGEMAQVKSFEQLTGELKRLTANGWVWVSVYFVAVVAGRDHAPEAGATAWTGGELWSQYLRHFRRMLI